MARVTLQALLTVELILDVAVDADTEEEAAELVRDSVLEGAARREWDLVSLSAARALKRLERKGVVIGLRIARQVADELPELLSDSMPEDEAADGR